MTARLYRTTRPLHAAVPPGPGRPAPGGGGHADDGRADRALYVTGLVLLDERQTQTRVARHLPGRCHDARNRLLRAMPLSTRAVMGLLHPLGRPAGAARLPVRGRRDRGEAVEPALRWAGWAYAWAKTRQVYGRHLVVVRWCSDDGRWRLPVAFRLWRPKAACAPRALPHQAGAGGGDAARVGGGATAGGFRRLRHAVHRRLADHAGRPARLALGRHPRPAHHGGLARQAAGAARGRPAAAAQVARTWGGARRRRGSPPRPSGTCGWS